MPAVRLAFVAEIVRALDSNEHARCSVRAWHFVRRRRRCRTRRWLRLCFAQGCCFVRRRGGAHGFGAARRRHLRLRRPGLRSGGRNVDWFRRRRPRLRNARRHRDAGRRCSRRWPGARRRGLWFVPHHWRRRAMKQAPALDEEGGEGDDGQREHHDRQGVRELLAPHPAADGVLGVGQFHVSLLARALFVEIGQAAQRACAVSFPGRTVHQGQSLRRQLRQRPDLFRHARMQ
jgi:hypothetical protein